MLYRAGQVDFSSGNLILKPTDPAGNMKCFLPKYFRTKVQNSAFEISFETSQTEPWFFLLKSVFGVCRTLMWSILFMRIKNLVTIFENLCITEKTSQKWCHIHGVCRQHYSMNNPLFTICSNVNLSDRFSNQSVESKLSQPLSDELALFRTLSRGFC